MGKKDGATFLFLPFLNPAPTTNSLESLALGYTIASPAIASIYTPPKSFYKRDPFKSHIMLQLHSHIQAKNGAA